MEVMRNQLPILRMRWEAVINSITKKIADVGLKSVTIGQTARRKPMIQLLPLLLEEKVGGGEEEDSGSEEESTSENDVRSRLQFSGKRIVS